MSKRKQSAAELSPEAVLRELTRPLGKGASTKQKRETLTTILPSLREKANNAIAKARDPRGRKSTYTRERFLAVLDRMMDGNPCHEALRAEGIASSTFHDWLQVESEEGDFCRKAYARARQALADWAFSEALSVPQRVLAMASAPPTVTESGRVIPAVDQSLIGAARLVTDTLKWYAERLNPGQYAERKEPPATVNVTSNTLTLSASELDPSQREQLRALLLAARDKPVLAIDADAGKGD